MSSSTNPTHSHGPNGCQHTPHESQPIRVKDSRAAAQRIVCALIIIFIALATACLVQVRSGEAIVITHFGNPSRVLVEPGLTARLPTPFESELPVDLRLRTTSSGLQDVGTKDGLRIIVQAYIIWQVQPDSESILRFIRAMPTNSDTEAAKQIRTFMGSALETTASSYDLANLINTDADRVQLADFEQHLRSQLEPALSSTYGIKIVQVGVERLTLPSITLTATVNRMRAEREIIATELTAEGKRKAAEIRSAAERDARILVADASIKAADINSQAIVDASKLYGQAYSQSPQLYLYLRSLDTLDAVVNQNTRIVLRTDAAPFRALIEGPYSLLGSAKKAPDDKHE